VDFVSAMNETYLAVGPGKASKKGEAARLHPFPK